MSVAKKCNRCADLFVPKSDDLIIMELVRHACGKEGPKGNTEHHQSVIDEENPYDLCTNCSRGLRNFLKPIQHSESHREGGEP